MGYKFPDDDGFRHGDYDEGNERVEYGVPDEYGMVTILLECPDPYNYGQFVSVAHRYDPSIVSMDTSSRDTNRSKGRPLEEPPKQDNFNVLPIAVGVGVGVGTLFS